MTAGRVGRALALGAVLLASCEQAEDAPIPAAIEAATEAASEPAAQPSTDTTDVADPADEELQPWTGDDDQVDLYSALVTAASCARAFAEFKNPSSIDQCSPVAAAKTGFALVDPTEQLIYYLEQDSVYLFELEHAFGGSMDVSGTILGTLGGVPVIEPDEHSITPRPKPGAFKGCL